MKGYFITDAQMADLHRRIELSYTKAKVGRNTIVHDLDDLYYSINLGVHEWVREIGKN